MSTPKPTIILASGSPRRKELLALTGWQYSIQPADVDETPINGEAPEEYVYRLAQSKALAVAQNAPEGAVVIAADTTVVDAGEILGKPADEDESWEMLERLRGHTHQVYTAVAVTRAGSGNVEQALVCTDVPMRNYSDKEMRSYIATGDPFDKAGGYAIQHNGFRPVENLSGCYANVVGMPLCHLLVLLEKLGYSPTENTPAACQALLQYTCPVFAQILRGEL